MKRRSRMKNEDIADNKNDVTKKKNKGAGAEEYEKEQTKE
jgi:hypothetical protein